MKKLFFLFTLLMALSSCNQEDMQLSVDNMQFPLKEDVQNEPEGATQESALVAYEELVGTFANTQSRSGGETEYPTWFGGAYVNSESQLVVKTTNSQINGLKSLDDIVVSQCQYSLNDFSKVTNRITQLANSGDKFVLDNIIMYGEDIQSNSYVVGIRNDCDQVRREFLNKVSSCPFIKFVKCGNIELTSTPLRCASRIANYDKTQATAASIGYRAKKSDGTIGIVTAGHFISKNQALSLGDKTIIGKCVDSSNYDGTLDAAFCSITNSSYMPSNQIEYMTDVAKDTLSTDLAQPPTGSIVNMVGYVSKRKSGTIYEASRNVIINKKQVLADVILMTCIPVEGDSGGVVYALTSSINKRSTVGINVGTLKIDYSDGSSATYGICCKAYLINKTFNISRY